MKTLDIDRPTLDDPLYSQKNPHQTFLLVFSVFATVPLFLGGESPSSALSSKTSEFGLYVWAALLFFGSITALVGEFWRGHTWTALVIEMGGLVLVGGGGLIFVLILHNSGHHGYAGPDNLRYVMGITSAYALSCLWRVVQILFRLRWLRKIIAEVNARHASEEAQ